MKNKILYPYFLLLIFSFVSCSQVISFDEVGKATVANSTDNDMLCYSDTSSQTDDFVSNTDSKSNQQDEVSVDSTTNCDSGVVFDEDFNQVDNESSGETISDTDMLISEKDITSDNNTISDNATIDESSDFSDEDFETPDSDFSTEIFPDNFSLSKCDCGKNPKYNPVCCNKNIVVFNKCFANCFALYSLKTHKICQNYEDKECNLTSNSDEDSEVPDSDNPLEPQCFPQDKNFFCCNLGEIYSSQCLADFQCKDNYKQCSF